MGVFLSSFSVFFPSGKPERQDVSRSKQDFLVATLCSPPATFGQQSDRGSPLCRATEGRGLWATWMAGDTSCARTAVSTTSSLPLEGHEIVRQEL